MGKSSLGPGFRFSPTDVELVVYYLKKKLLGKWFVPGVIAEVNIYDFSPRDLPAKSYLKDGDLEWFFFCSKSKKYSSGSRTNRATKDGYWKATGKDKAVEYNEKTVAMIKTLVFYLGHPPKGIRTNWVIHEYRMEDKDLADAGVVQEAYVICRLFEKSGPGPKNGAQYGAPFDEEEWNGDIGCSESSVVVNQSGAIPLVKPNGSSSVVTDMTSTEPGPSTVTSSAVVDLFGSTKKRKFDASCSAVTNMTLTEPGPSTITSENEGRIDAPANDDFITPKDFASILNDNNIQDVDDRKGKKVVTSSPYEDDKIFKDFATTYNLDDFNILDFDGSDDFTLILGPEQPVMKIDASSSAVTNLNFTEPGPSTIISENEGRIDVPANDDYITPEDFASILNDNIQEVDDRKGKKVMTSPPYEYGNIFKDFEDFSAMYNLDDLSRNEFNNVFNIDGSADCMVMDDLDGDLAKFV